VELLSDVDLKEWGSVKHVGALIEAMRTTEKFRKDFINEKLHSEGLEELLKDEELISSYKALFIQKLNLWGNTTHISVFDSEGNGVSVTTTNGEGSGVVIPGTGVMLNNMLGEEDLNPLGFFKWPPYVRLPSMMSPTAVFRGERPLILLGSAGSNRIRSAIVQTALNSLLFGMSPAESVGAPRLHYENGEVFLEPGFLEETISEVRRHYRTTLFKEKSLFFGGVQLVTSEFEGAGDPRRGGLSIRIF